MPTLVCAMPLNFDVDIFCENLKSTKPPYRCPVDTCQRIFRSHAGIVYHLYHFEHDGGLRASSTPPHSSSFDRSSNGAGEQEDRWSKGEEAMGSVSVTPKRCKSATKYVQLWVLSTEQNSKNNDTWTKAKYLQNILVICMELSLINLYAASYCCCQLLFKVWICFYF